MRPERGRIGRLAAVAAFAAAHVAGTPANRPPFGGDRDTDLHYAAFRVVRATPGEPSRPAVTLPDGYELVAGEQYHVASRAEYYSFVQGPRNEAGIPITVSWPGEHIEAVIWANERLEPLRDAGDPSTAAFRLPVVAASASASQSTLQVWSFMETAPGISWRIEHNDPDRLAGPWLEVPWPAGEVKAVVHYLVASEAILRDSGLAEEAAKGGHFYALMGFETNNTLHPDNPPHWHLAYYAGEDFGAPAYLPHFWIDSVGRNFYNGMDVTGEGRQRYRADEPAPMYDFAGNLIVTTTIRADGGLDVDPPAGPRYSIVRGSDGRFVDELAVERDGRAWLRIRANDDARAGELVIGIDDHQQPQNSRTMVHRYDRLTGTLLDP